MENLSVVMRKLDCVPMVLQPYIYFTSWQSWIDLTLYILQKFCIFSIALVYGKLE